MKNNTIKAAVMLSALSASPIASSLSTVYATDLMGFMGFLNVILHVAIALSPLFIALVLIHIVHYVYKGKPAKTLASASASMPVATSVNQRAFDKNQSRASKLAPPPMRVEEDGEVGDTAVPMDKSAVFQDEYAFLDEYPDVKLPYSLVVDLHARIKDSDMSLVLKHRADSLKITAEKTIDTLRSIHKVAPVAENNISNASSKLSSALKALSDIVESYQDAMNVEFDKIKISDTFEQQDELEQLRREGQALLNKINNDASFDISEDKFRLNKIVNERLDQVWRDYTAAKRKYYAPAPNETLLITDQRSSQDPDAALNNVFSEIKSIYSDIELGVKTKQKEITMTNLLANKNYFESR